MRTRRASAYPPGMTPTDRSRPPVTVANAPYRDVPRGLLEFAKDNPYEAGLLAASMSGAVGNEPIATIADGLLTIKETKDAYDKEGLWPAIKTGAIGTALTALPFVGMGAVKAVRGGADLPMDEASRMARADEHFPIDAYHGTRGDFSEFERGDIGFHFGTEEQANKRLMGTRRERGIEGENVIPARLNIRNPVELPDVGQWDNPEVVARGLLANSKWGQTRAGPLDEILSEAEDLSRQFEDVDAWKASPEAAGLLSEIQGLMRGDGYDGARYLNQVENQYGDLTGFNRVAQKEYDALNKEYHELRKAIAARRRPLPDGEVSEAELQEWLDQPSPKATAAEEARFAEIAAAGRRLEDTGRNSPYSYIAFDPSQVRARSAKFDPRNLNSSDLLAGVAGAGLLGVGARAAMPSEDERGLLY